MVNRLRGLFELAAGVLDLERVATTPNDLLCVGVIQELGPRTEVSAERRGLAAEVFFFSLNLERISVREKGEVVVMEEEEEEEEGVREKGEVVVMEEEEEEEAGVREKGEVLVMEEEEEGGREKGEVVVIEEEEEEEEG